MGESGNREQGSGKSQQVDELMSEWGDKSMSERVGLSMKAGIWEQAAGNFQFVDELMSG